MSLPSRERGLKWLPSEEQMGRVRVATLAGAWIEMIIEQKGGHLWQQSLPSRERGLKSDRRIPMQISHKVAPLAGAWIEI